MNIYGVIPARYASTRFPGKPLIDLAGKTMIQRVYEQSKKCSLLKDVIIATDDQRIFDHAISIGARVVMTSENHTSGTDRCAEVLDQLSDCDVIINIQGDEPLINPDQISLLCRCFDDPKTDIATLIKIIESEETLFNNNTPKVILDHQSFAMYFSRECIPHLRNIDKKDWLKKFNYYQHIGIYGYTSDVLKKITKLQASSLEQAESLEQLRWLENGYKIKTAITTFESIAIDCVEDVEKVLVHLKN
jgi:3-deoxy-manno-octulosonate cytidylyltransferase (CMP-KDO synthetase)